MGHSNDEQYDGEDKQKETSLSQISRWPYLLSMGEEHIPASISEEYGSYDPAKDHAARVTILEWQRWWKCRSLNLMAVSNV